MTVESVENVSTSSPESVKENLTANNSEAKPSEPAIKRGPADDLKDIQALLVMGIYPGNMAPQVCKAYTLLDNMVKQIEAKNDPK